MQNLLLSRTEQILNFCSKIIVEIDKMIIDNEVKLKLFWTE